VAKLVTLWRFHLAHSAQDGDKMPLSQTVLHEIADRSSHGNIQRYFSGHGWHISRNRTIEAVERTLFFVDVRFLSSKE
jgi:hypothetical protein